MNHLPNHGSQTILIVEDNPDDFFILQRAFNQAGISNELWHAADGQEAIDRLQEAAQPLPSLVLLDLKLPIRHGLEVLAWIREQPHLKGLIVLILTSSSEERDVARAYELGTNAFLVKPSSSQTLTEIMRAVDHFWLKFNKARTLPSC